MGIGASEEERMRIVDLSHVIEPGMPVYPGTEPPRLEDACTIERDGFAEKKVTFYSHTGTHVDAPAHLLQDGRTLDRYPIEHFCGEAVCLNFDRPGLRTISHADLEPHRPSIERAKFVLLRTGWSRHWGRPSYFANYPILSSEAAEWLVGLRLRGIGLDTISADAPEAEGLPIHRVLLGEGLILVENLTSLDSLPDGVFTFLCFPLRLENADGSPVRAVACLESH